MKRIIYFLNSFSGKIVLFLSAFAVGVTTNAFFEPAKNTPLAVPLYRQEQLREQDSDSSSLAGDDNKEPDADSKPKFVQSSIINFPKSGRVIVQAREQVGEFPEMIFVSAKTGKVLLRSSVKDKSLIPDNGDWTQPHLGFHIIRSASLIGPAIMAVGACPGGSDNGFSLTVFGEVAGKLSQLNDKPLSTSNQGGYYLGNLSKNLGYGLAVWDFIWGNGTGECHYCKHRYEIEIYKLEDGKLKRTLRRASRKRYDSEKGVESLHEFGITGHDQRTGISRIKDFLD